MSRTFQAPVTYCISFWMALVGVAVAFVSIAPMPIPTIRTTRLNGFLDRGQPSYSDNWLLQQHNKAQSQYICKTNSLTVYNELLAAEHASIKEWQDSFQRNDLADFTPPMSAGLNCLMVGDYWNDDNDGENQAGSTKLPWEDTAEAEITSLRAQVVNAPVFHMPSDGFDGAATMETTRSSIDTKNCIQIETSWIPSKAARATTHVAGLVTAGNGIPKAAMYDCIVDQGGLLGGLLEHSHRNQQQTTELLQEVLHQAAYSLREHGIYVLTTTGPQQLSTQNKELLTQLGLEAGLEWNFALDGISTPHQQVSAARRFNTGAMPSFGKLAAKNGRGNDTNENAQQSYYQPPNPNWNSTP